MGQDGLGRPHRLPAGSPEAQAEIDVVEIDREGHGIETAHRPVLVAGDREAGGGDRGNLVGDPHPAEMARRFGRAAAQDMTRLAAEADDDAGMLEAPVLVEELGTDRADLRPHGLGDHRVEPVGMQHPPRRC